MKKLLVGVVAVLAAVSVASAASFVLPGVTNVEKGATVVIPVSVTGALSPANLQGVNLAFQVDAPLELTGISFDAGTVFNGIHNPPSLLVYPDPDGILPSAQYLVASLTTIDPQTAPLGVIALLSVKAGAQEGDFTLMTQIPGVQASDLASRGAADQASGIIHVTPEPMTALLLLAALPFIRRRTA